MTERPCVTTSCGFGGKSATHSDLKSATLRVVGARSLVEPHRLPGLQQGESRCQPRECRCRSVREILRLRAEGLSDRAIARSTLLARSTVSDYAGRVAASGLSWPLPEGLTDTALEALLFVRGGQAAGARRKPEPDWPNLHRELRRAGVTLMLLCRVPARCARGLRLLALLRTLRGVGGKRRFQATALSSVTSA